MAEQACPGSFDAISCAQGSMYNIPRAGCTKSQMVLLSLKQQQKQGKFERLAWSTHVSTPKVTCPPSYTLLSATVVNTHRDGAAARRGL
jgi:hypothetical protein